MSKRSKQICWSCVCLFMLGLLLTWVMISCRTETKFDEIKNIPTVEASNDRYIKRSDIGYHFTHKRGFNSVTLNTPANMGVLQLDSKYQQVDYWWFLKYNNWWLNMLHDNGIRPIDQSENHDCDNFAMLYKSLASVAAFKSNIKTELAVAVIIVRQHNEFGRIPGTGGLHMLNLIMTNNGWYVYEPQTNTRVLLENYVNQQHIQNIII